MGLSILISAPKLKLFQRKLVTLQMHESAAVDLPTLRSTDFGSYSAQQATGSKRSSARGAFLLSTVGVSEEFFGVVWG